MRPLFYEIKLRKWSLFFTREEMGRYFPDWQHISIEEGDIYSIPADELEAIWRRSKSIRRAKAMKARMEHES